LKRSTKRRNNPENPFKSFKTREEIREIHGGLFKKFIEIRSYKYKEGPKGNFEIFLRYELNISRYNDLIKLLEKRNAFQKEWDSIPYSKNKKRLNVSDIKKRGLPKGAIAYYPSRKKPHKFNTIEKFNSERLRFHQLLDKEFKFSKLSHVHNPDDPKDKYGYPFFDLRYVLRQEDLKKWAKVIRLELEYRIGFNLPKKGQPPKKSTYPQEVFMAYEKHFDYAMNNQKMPEVGGIKPHHWAAKKTMEEFPNLEIRASTLTKLVIKWRKKKT
jgi:hypothetical protein